jgi:hypothetical protein
MLLILLLTNPQLMKAAQAGENRAPNPSGIFPLDDTARGNKLIAGTGIDSINFVIQAFVEFIQESRTTSNNDILKQQGR